MVRYPFNGLRMRLQNIWITFSCYVLVRNRSNICSMELSMPVRKGTPLLFWYDSVKTPRLDIATLTCYFQSYVVKSMGHIHFSTDDTAVCFYFAWYKVPSNLTFHVPDAFVLNLLKTMTRCTGGGGGVGGGWGWWVAVVLLNCHSRMNTGPEQQGPLLLTWINFNPSMDK